MVWGPSGVGVPLLKLPSETCVIVAVPFVIRPSPFHADREARLWWLWREMVKEPVAINPRRGADSSVQPSAGAIAVLVMDSTCEGAADPRARCLDSPGSCGRTGLREIAHDASHYTVRLMTWVAAP